MDEILSIILNSCSFLYKEYEFKFSDSQTSRSFGNDAYLTLSRGDVSLRFISDRGQIFLDVSAVPFKSGMHWYSFDLIRQLITGEKEYYSLIDERNITFLRENIAAIISKFGKKEIAETIKRLNQLRDYRSEVRFGATC